MGLFDYIRCHVPLPPDGEISVDEFQTKDLDNCLLHFEIREDGTLWEKRVNYKWVDEPELELVPTENEPEWVQLTDVHRDVRFYGGQKEYVVRFNNGKLQYIKYEDFLRGYHGKE